MFGRQIRLNSLALLCRSLGTLLGSGVGIKKALKTAAQKTSDPRCQEAMRGVFETVAEGDEMATGMRAQGDAFPPLMIDMVHVAEQTGALPEILKSLARHYENLVRLRRNLIHQLSWPAFQYVAAVMIIALLILVLGMIAESQGGKPIQFLPGGLSGAGGAATWLMVNFGVVFGLFVLYQWTRHSLAGQQFLDPLLMRIPVVGSCLRSFAIARFSWAFALTQQSGMSTGPSLESSFKATGNGAFVAAYPPTWAMMQAGESLHTALLATGLFPEDYLQMVHAAEVSGTVPEMLDHLSPQFEEDARRSLQALTSGLGWTVYAVVAMFVIFLIFRVAGVYIGALNEAGRPI